MPTSAIRGRPHRVRPASPRPAGDPISVRRATVQDVPGIVRCLHAAFAPYRHQYTRAAYAETTLNLSTARARLRGMRVLVAVDRAGHLLGTVAWMRKPSGIGYLRGMAVDPRRFGTGIAQRLLDRALAEQRGAGIRRVALHTTHPLERAIRFYRRNGFRLSGPRGQYFGMETLRFARDLDRASPSPRGTKRRSRSRSPAGTGSRARRSSSGTSRSRSRGTGTA